MGNFIFKDMQVKRTKIGGLLLLVYLQDEDTKEIVNWAADWEEFAKVFEAAFLVERANLIERIKRLINKVISIDTLPLTRSLKRVLETSKETERRFTELKEVISPLEEEAKGELMEAGVKFREWEGEAELRTIRDKWGVFINSLAGEGASGNLNAFVQACCEPVAVEDNALVLGFYYSFHKEKIQDPKYTRLMERKLEEVFGKHYRLRCVLIEKRIWKEPSKKRGR